MPGFAALLSGACAALLAGAGAARAQLVVEVIGAPGGRTIVTVRPGAISPTRQGLGQFVGISGANSGAAIAIVARNDPEEQEHVELLDPAAVPGP